MNRLLLSTLLVLATSAAAAQTPPDQAPPAPPDEAPAPTEAAPAPAAPVRSEVFRKGTGQVVVHSVEPAAGSVRAKCTQSGEWSGPAPTFVFPDEPALVIDFERPTGNVKIGYTIAGKGAVAHHVTFRSGKTGCWLLDDDSARNFGASRLGDGLTLEGPYELRVGFIEGKPRPRVTVVVREQSTRVDPLSVVLDAPAELPFDQRLIDRYVPLFNLGYSQAEDLSLMFAKASPSLRVFAKYDFDADVVTPLFMKELYGQAAKDYLAQLAYPRKDEPLLMGDDNKGRFVVTADGLRFRLKSRSALVAAPTGAPVFPTTMRNVDIDLGKGARHASAALVAKVEKHRARADKAETCWRKTVKDLGGFLDRGVKMYEVTYRNGRVAKVEDYGHKAARKASAKCGVKAVQKAEEALLGALIKEYVARGQERLRALAQQ